MRSNSIICDVCGCEIREAFAELYQRPCEPVGGADAAYIDSDSHPLFFEGLDLCASCVPSPQELVEALQSCGMKRAIDAGDVGNT